MSKTDKGDEVAGERGWGESNGATGTFSMLYICKRSATQPEIETLKRKVHRGAHSLRKWNRTRVGITFAGTPANNVNHFWTPFSRVSFFAPGKWDVKKKRRRRDTTAERCRSSTLHPEVSRVLCYIFRDFMTCLLLAVIRYLECALKCCLACGIWQGLG